MGRREGPFEEGVEDTIVVAEDDRSGFNDSRSLLNFVDDYNEVSWVALYTVCMHIYIYSQDCKFSF